METLTSLSLGQVIDLLFLYVIALAGMLLHFLRKKIRGESVGNIKNYFFTHFKSTLAALLVTTIGTLIYYFQIQDANLNIFMNIAIFGTLGYNCDSFLNKWENKEIKIGE